MINDIISSYLSPKGQPEGACPFGTHWPLGPFYCNLFHFSLSTRYHTLNSTLSEDKARTEAGRPLPPWVSMNPMYLGFYEMKDGFIVLPLGGRRRWTRRRPGLCFRNRGIPVRIHGRCGCCGRRIR